VTKEEAHDETVSASLSQRRFLMEIVALFALGDMMHSMRQQFSEAFLHLLKIKAVLATFPS